ncbi:uncharacterized protein LOC122384613 isoform X5 [Amphibalanus amphitrite]|uniref:uncharacterized protein LOC122384613 isoform X5 n=1 Tax=Amphibalanus amphitrite TaxID=1232801 RepID=UPI001C91D1DE|nr:uncharacterized protein LOC122384613 isoform X5 [Amphibalanus amphitrite]
MNDGATESCSQILRVKEEVKEEDLSAPEDGSSADECLMLQEPQESCRDAVNIKPELPSQIGDSREIIVKAEDDDWDAKWRVDVPDRDPLELAPDTKKAFLGDGAVKEESEASIAAVGEGDQATGSTDIVFAIRLHRWLATTHCIS